MRKILALLLFLTLVLPEKRANAQLLPPNQPEQDACNALLLCGNSFFTPYSYQGIGLVSDITNCQCTALGTPAGEDNSVWFKLMVNTPGSIVFEITPVNSADDYDFLVADITNVTCSTFTGANVIRCNFNNNLPPYNNGILGLNTTSTTLYGPVNSTISYLQQINANAGDVYLIMVNNYGVGFGGAPSSGFTIDFTGSTATFNTTNPAMSYVIPSCNNSQQVTLQMNTNIKCNSIAANGSDFWVSGGGSVAAATGTNCLSPNGYTDKLVLNFASPLPPGTYTLGVQPGTDGNTLIDLCDTPVPVTDTIQFTIAPYVAPGFVAIDTPGCSEIRFKLAGRVRCDSIAANGSDYVITGPQPVTILSAYGVGCDTTNFSDTILLVLQAPLQTDGVYTITAQKGTDGNTQLDSCGLYQPVGDAITLTINSYDGRLVASPDTILCKAQYFLLNADNSSVPPSETINCENTNFSCSGNISAAFVGSKDTSMDINSPFYGGWSDSRAQYLFLTSELRTMGLKPGSIGALDWKVTQKLSSIPYDNFSIKIGCTPLNNISGNFQGPLQDVYASASYSTVPGWNSFTLSTPYNWDGVSNIIVEVCYDNASSSLSDRVAHGITSFSSVVHRFGNGLSGCAMTTQGTLSTVASFRPKLRFHICEPPSGSPGYMWTPGDFLSDSTIHQPLAYAASGTTFHVTTIDKYGCAHRDSSVLTFSIRHPELTPVPDTTICYGTKLLLMASGGISYTWMAADLTTLSCINCPEPLASPYQTSVYSVVIGDQYNCTDTLGTTVFVNPLPPVTVLPNDTTVKYGYTIQLIGNGANLYNWYPAGAVSDPNIPTPTATITQPVVIILTGIDDNGCRNTDSIRINVDYTDPVFIPSAFSPNGDGTNDVFKVGSMSFQKLLEFRVFNRWGQEVFSTTDVLKGWDGTYKGQKQDPGVYQYMIRLAYPDGKVSLYKGDVTLIR